MKLFKKSFFAFIICCLSFNVNAASKCDNAETAKLNKLVSNIKVSYEEKQGVLDPSEYTLPETVIGTEEEKTFFVTYNYFKISIINLTEDFYITVQNNKDKQVKTYTYANSDNGVITFDWKNLKEVTTFTIKVYASDKTGCAKEEYKTMYETTPRGNKYYSYDICQQAPEYYLCQKYVTSDEIDYNTFLVNIEKYIDSKEKEQQRIDEENTKWYEKVGEFLEENKITVIVGTIVIVVIGGVGVAVVMKVRRRDEI